MRLRENDDKSYEVNYLVVLPSGGQETVLQCVSSMSVLTCV